ncbi:MAG: TIR domain-containing protein [Thermoanaerobaculales bacterium]|nr:TIR domain-containing protein [Thermoanaerobaculales bacterium]
MLHIIESFQEGKILFTESTLLTGTAAAMKFGGRGEPAAKHWVKEYNEQKAWSRRAFQLYERGKDYSQTISSDSIRGELAPVPNAIIEETVLRGLLNVRRECPREYSRLPMKLDGLAPILGISIRQIEFVLSVLAEEGLVEAPSLSGAADSGETICITSLGVRTLEGSRPKTSVQNHSIQQLSTIDAPPEADRQNHDVAISFAGEQRDLAESIAHALTRESISVFYDGFEKTTLWGRNLHDHLQDVYQQATFCVMIISKEYASKVWPNHERKAAQARAMRESREYILPIRVDDTLISGLLETVGYVQYPQTSVEEIAEMVIAKLNGITAGRWE